MSESGVVEISVQEASDFIERVVRTEYEEKRPFLVSDLGSAFLRNFNNIKFAAAFPGYTFLKFISEYLDGRIVPHRSERVPGRVYVVPSGADVSFLDTTQGEASLTPVARGASTFLYKKGFWAAFKNPQGRRDLCRTIPRNPVGDVIYDERDCSAIPDDRIVIDKKYIPVEFVETSQDYANVYRNIDAWASENGVDIERYKNTLGEAAGEQKSNSHNGGDASRAGKGDALGANFWANLNLLSDIDLARISIPGDIVNKLASMKR